MTNRDIRAYIGTILMLFPVAISYFEGEFVISLLVFLTGVVVFNWKQDEGNELRLKASYKLRSVFASLTAIFTIRAIEEVIEVSVLYNSVMSSFLFQFAYVSLITTSCFVRVKYCNKGQSEYEAA